MFGTDWHMLYQEGKNRTFLQKYIQLFEQTPELEIYKADFFENNAKQFFKLT